MNSKVEMSPVKAEDECLQKMIENCVRRIGKKKKNKPQVLLFVPFLFQSFLTELAAGKGQLGEIENLAVKYGKSSPGKCAEIQIWLEEINNR